MDRRLWGGTGGQETPLALVTLVSPRYLYWSDWGSRPHIARGAQDGAPPKPLVTEDVERPQGLALGEGPTAVPKRVPWPVLCPQTCPRVPQTPSRLPHVSLTFQCLYWVPLYVPSPVSPLTPMFPHVPPVTP